MKSTIGIVRNKMIGGLVDQKSLHLGGITYMNPAFWNSLSESERQKWRADAARERERRIWEALDAPYVTEAEYRKHVAKRHTR